MHSSTRSVFIVLGPVIVAAPLALGDTKQPCENILRVARSSDGLRFTPDPEPFVIGGSSPDIERLEDGELVAVYDAPPKEEHKSTTLTLVRSKDGGRTWSTPEPIEWDDSSLPKREARGGDLVVEEDGTLRLYFAAAPPPTARGRSHSPPVIRSATTRGGARFKLDSAVSFRCRGLLDPRICVIRGGKRRVMLVSNAIAASKRKEESFSIGQAVSRDGRTFAPTAPILLDAEVHITSVVALDQGFRGYGWTDDGVVSLRSDDLKDWEIEKGSRLSGAWDPAVVRLQNGTYLMIYNAGPRPKAPPAVDASLPLTGSDAASADGADLTLAEAFEPPLEEVEPDETGLAPQPDFADPVDYSKWYREHALEPTDDNAYDAYIAFMPKFDEDGVADREDWPEFNDMFNSGEHVGPPKPWKPEEQPEWEDTHKNSTEVLAKFREANQRTGYATRVDPTPDSDPAGPSEDRLLMNLELPHLQPHRTLAKATLADSWRAGQDGRVDPDHMIDAWKTVLRGAEHIERGSTLIENLVGVAERGAVESNARWALKQGVFDEKKLEQALDALRQYDRSVGDPVKGVRGEHAMALDTTQYLFSPPDANGQPVINPDRVERMQEIIGDESETTREEIEKMVPDDARTTIEAFNNYYPELAEQMRIGYPEVRASDLEALADQYLGISPITKILLPSMSRAHVLRARAEASRRATQLAYAAHIHHARTGQWPKSLDELPRDLDDEIRTDPFTGRPFGYRLGRDGPTIYSASENGIDDQGAHSPRWNDGITDPAASDDYVFWPPQR